MKSRADAMLRYFLSSWDKVEVTIITLTSCWEHATALCVDLAKH